MQGSKRAISGIALIAAVMAVQPSFASDGEVVDLGDIQVTGLSQELGMRAIKLALDTPRSSRVEDRDKLVCWFDKVTGSHMTQLYCATNAVLEEAGDFASAALGGPSTAASASAQKKIRSWQVNRGEFEAAMAALGPADLNAEIVGRAMQGEPLPDNVPTADELDRFAAAMARVRGIAAEYDPRIAEASGGERERLLNESDSLMAKAIVESGLTVERYNEISELVSRFNALRDHVRERLAAR